MNLGVHIGYWVLGLTADDQREIVQEAERLGFDSVWTAEAYGSDAATILGWLAAVTEKIKLGSRSEEHTSELQSRQYLVCRLLLEKKKADKNETVSGRMDVMDTAEYL